MRSGILISVVSLLLAGASSSGCARQSAHANQPTTIVFAHAKHPNSAYLSELVGTFERQNPGIRVREEILPSSSDQQHQYYVINLAARARDVDVFDMDVIWVPEFARAG
jgi:multiple sugar transport system substrate-binding protein